ncbi:hypothetical protein BZG36_04285 [Bifiguratus adelaidae]|uniref:Small ribosomal subunit protein bS18m n=1 Tax=Bifiguratus adelaidae TaxID=1938954 RepID=A0A261XW77_9FUNG|nr:hypothetical protein BZG36_04285 [Bifiguratus adelaidae]
MGLLRSFTARPLVAGIVRLHTARICANIASTQADNIDDKGSLKANPEIRRIIDQLDKVKQKQSASGNTTPRFRKMFKSGETYHPDDLNDTLQEQRMRARRFKKPIPIEDPFETLGLNPLHEYKNHTLLSSFVSDMGKILPRSQTGVSAKNQRKLALAIKRARAMASTALLYHLTRSNALSIYHHRSTVRIKVADGSESMSFVDCVKQKCPSLYGPKAIFRPTWWLFNGHLQTAYASFYNAISKDDPIPYARQILSTVDGGQVSLDWTPAIPSSDSTTPTLVVLHGLTGGSHESYVRSLVARIRQHPSGYQAVVYCGAWTADFKFAIENIAKRWPNMPLVGAGFSLGSNVLVKYLGEEGDRTPLRAGVSVGNPFDFLGASLHVERTWFRRKIYARAMAKACKKLFLKHAKVILQNPAIDYETVMNTKTLRQFDQAVTVPTFGYETVAAFYRDASSARFITKVKIPLLCLSARDDPISPEECLPIDECLYNPHVILATTRIGGHLGWFEETDVMKLLMSDYEVTLVNDNMQEFYVRFHGPAGTPFAGGVWKVHVELPDQYPYKSPSIGFMNRIFHPNIDELSGSVCLDVINQTWSPMFDMINIFEVFLPQLLRYPNATDPLNGEAAALLMREQSSYESKVKEYVARYATKEAADAATDESSEEEEMSSVNYSSGEEDETAGMEL